MWARRKKDGVLCNGDLCWETSARWTIALPLNWDIGPDRKSLSCVAMSGNALHAYDLGGEASTIAGRTVGPLLPGATTTDCRALCVGPKA